MPGTFLEGRMTTHPISATKNQKENQKNKNNINNNKEGVVSVGSPSRQVVLYMLFLQPDIISKGKEKSQSVSSSWTDISFTMRNMNP